jgi:NAD(P)-dependent dehydrogenase (short-subunit alcohol dehydrogenase family)
MTTSPHDSTVMRLQGFDGRVAVVTGAGRGIGRRIAETFTALGARTAALDLEAPEVPGSLGVRVDVTDPASVAGAFAEVEASLGPVDILVLNAGIFVIEPLAEVTFESWRRTMAVNLDGAFLCAQRVLPGMKDRGRGRIVAIGSSAGITGGSKSAAAYAASKAGVMALAKAIAQEHMRDGITANAVAPTLIRTPMIAGMADLAEKVPIGRLGEPDDVAACVAFLCSDHASYVTGEILDVNGGWLID